MNMPRVSMCDAVDCSYNQDRKCHALAITVGEAEPCCDTYFKAQNKGGISENIGGVGACKVQDCRYNKLFECSAGSIQVGIPSGHADCVTYKPR